MLPTAMRTGRTLKLFVSEEVVEGQIDAYLGPTVGLIMRAAIFVDWFDWLVGCVSELKLKLKMQVWLVRRSQ